MPQWLNKWNAIGAKWLWWVVLVGIVAALPVMYARVQTETSADNYEIVMDYRDLLQVSSTQPNPQVFVQEQLKRLKDAGVNAMTVFESTLEELGWAGEINVYNATQAALLEGKLSPPEDNATYVVFNQPGDETTLRPIIEQAFARHGAAVTNWSIKGADGLRIDMGYDDALLRPMQPNPLAMKMLKDEGFNLVPRLSDRFPSFDAAEVDRWLSSFQTLGVKYVLFDGESVTGFGEGKKFDNLKTFSYSLKKYGIGIGMFENLKVPQRGAAKLANFLGYNAIRAHSVGEAEMTVIKKPVLEDRLILAVKDRDIRLLYLNAVAVKDTLKGKVSQPLDNIIDVLQGEEDGSKGVIAQLHDFGYDVGEPSAFKVHHAPQETLLRGLTMLAAITLVALTIGLFAPALLVIALVLGYIGGAGLYVVAPTLMVQALALVAAICAPTAAVVLLVKKLRTLRESASSPISVSRRIGGALLLFARTTVLSLAGIPFIVALLNHISYNLVLQQFRGVGLLHLAPIGLVALYVFLYGGNNTVVGNAKRILAMPLTVLWIVCLGVLGAAGLYYLTRTGNSGQVSGLEMQFRSILENTFGVRPRTKEFLLGHPIFFAGIFLALRYRWGSVLIIAGTIAQLSMVDTFAHIHTPLLLSIIRVLLGLGIGLVLGFILIAVWQILEKLYGVWLKRSGAVL
ncbi:DUF5693 family protein [Cohnella soli]|uniref:DUF5693 family protein n=1 Tax=Cohnella soli TaxID=425005 RepID=A0ABW0HST3_9BACL